MTRYVEPPEVYNQSEDDPPAMFLAGGITGCPDWQADVRAALDGAHCVLLNPRRRNYDHTDPDATAEQVAWEYHHLNNIPRLLTFFWFPACDPAVTVQPIALYELGRAATRWSQNRPLLVGAAPDYPRRTDVVLQLAHACPGLHVYDTLEDLLTETRALIDPVWAIETGSY